VQYFLKEYQWHKVGITISYPNTYDGSYIMTMEDLQRENRELKEEVNHLRKALE